MKQTIILILLCWPFFSMCQPITINGKVVNENDEPVASATIILKRTNQTVISDVKGLFTIHASRLTDTLIVSATGYETIQEPNNERGIITITLKHSVISLGEVIISTGYQDIPKERATGSFEFIDNKKLGRIISTGILERLENNSAVYFDRRIGGQNISIRGRSTIFANATPLIVLDNFPYQGDIANINPNDIESITLLKDAAAASVWGAFSGNGVIIINTKKGKRTPQLEFTANLTIGQRPDLFYDRGFLNSADFIDVERMLFDKGFYNGDISNNINYPILSPVVELLVKRRSNLISAADSTSQINAWRQTDVRDQLQDFFFRSSRNRQYAINYSGGAANYNYFVSLGYDKNDAALVRNNNDRITIRSSGSYMPSSKWEINVGMTYTVSNNRNNNTGTTLAQPGGRSIYPYEQLRDASGNALVIAKEYRLGFLDTAGNGKLLDWKYRPMDELAMADNKNTLNDAWMSLGITYKLNKDISFQLKYQYEKQTGEGSSLHRQGTYVARSLINLFTQINGTQVKYQVPLGGILDQSVSSLTAHFIRGQFNYNRSWKGMHDVAFLGGAELRENHSTAANTRMYGYDDVLLTSGLVNYVDYLPTYDDLAFSSRISDGSFLSDGINRYVSVFANGSYTFKQRYIFSASARKDASNIFGVSANQKWVPLWSSGLAWQLDKEPFYHIPWLPYLKLRSTYGFNGNVDNTLSALATILYFDFPSSINNRVYASVRNPPNPELQWERINIINFGLDFATKNDRIAGTVEYYLKKGTDLIGQAPIDPTTGVQDNGMAFTYKGNVADMKGHGVELELNTKNLTGTVKWDSRFQFNYTTNEITKYKFRSATTGAYVNDGGYISPIEGKPVFTLLSYKWAGLDPLTGDPQGYDANKLVNKDYAALMNAKLTDLQYNGPALPVAYGFLTNTIAWKELSLSFNLSYKLGYYFRRSSINYNSLFGNWRAHADFIDRWQKPGDEKITNVPSMIYPNNSLRDAFYTGSSALVEKGDHVRMQDISLGYAFNAAQLKKFSIKSLQFYMYINNIGIIWRANKSGLDPDYYGGGYPLPRSIAFGLKTTF